MNDFSFLTTHFTQQNHLWSHQNLSAILCSLGCNEPYLPIAEMPTCGDLKSRDFFLDQHIPPHVTPLQKILFQSGPYTPSPKKFVFKLAPIPPPPPCNSAGKTWIYLSGTSISWIFIQSDSCLYRCNKEKTLFFLFATTTVQSCITLENDARNHNESIRSQMILEFWNLWSLNPSFLWATDPNFLLCRSFGYPYRRAEDWLCIRESWHICYCIFKKRKTLQKLYLS